MSTQLASPIVLQAEVTTQSFTVERTEDSPTDKTVRALVVLKESPRVHKWITVWEGAAYDSAGQWTDTTLAAAIKTILEA